jgi:hypothetical protein
MQEQILPLKQAGAQILTSVSDIDLYFINVRILEVLSNLLILINPNLDLDQTTFLIKSE